MYPSIISYSDDLAVTDGKAMISQKLRSLSVLHSNKSHIIESYCQHLVKYKQLDVLVHIQGNPASLNLGLWCRCSISLHAIVSTIDIDWILIYIKSFKPLVFKTSVFPKVSILGCCRHVSVTWKSCFCSEVLEHLIALQPECIINVRRPL